VNASDTPNMVDALQRYLFGKISYQVSSSIASHSHARLTSNSTFFCNAAVSDFNDNTETSRLKKILQRQSLRTKVFLFFFLFYVVVAILCCV